MTSPPPINAITCGDCLPLMRAMPAESVDIVVTSPPYNIMNTTGGGLKLIKYSRRASNWRSTQLKAGYPESDDNMPHAEYVRWQRRCLKQMMRLLKPTGAIFYNHKWRPQAGLLQDRSDILRGLPVRQIIIWHRTGGFNINTSHFVPSYEVIYMIAKPKFKLTNHAMLWGDVWRIDQCRSHWHPAPFPPELAQRCISSTATKNPVILDPFVGSGTTAAAAKALGKPFYGFDKAKEYCRRAQLLVDQTTPPLAL